MGPATQAILVNLVPQESFSKAVALSSSASTSPSSSARRWAACSTGRTENGLYDFLRAAGAAVVMMMREVGQAGQRQSARGTPCWKAALRLVEKVVLGAISLDLFAVLFGGATALLPALAHDVLHIGPSGLGALRTAPGIGAALCSIVLAFFPITRRVGAWMLGGVAVFGVCTIMLGATTSFIVALVALFLMGAGDMISVYVRHLLVQYETPDEIRGRVSAVNSVFIGASTSWANSNPASPPAGWA
jgi:hypothetical protein